MPEHLDWPDCLNVRDLGGLPTADGKAIRSAALIRSDNLNRLTEAGIEAFRASGVCRIVDVRSARECTTYPSPFAGSALHHNLPLVAPADPYDPSLSLGDNYTVMLNGNPDLFANAVRAIASAPPGAVVVACHAGKDRTGNVIALVLRLLGTPIDVVAADYAVVSDGLRRDFTELLDRVEDDVERTQLAEEFTARPETMRAVLRQLDDTYGGVWPYLRQGGLTTADVSALRARLL